MQWRRCGRVSQDMWWRSVSNDVLTCMLYFPSQHPQVSTCFLPNYIVAPCDMARSELCCGTVQLLRGSSRVTDWWLVSETWLLRRDLCQPSDEESVTANTWTHLKCVFFKKKDILLIKHWHFYTRIYYPSHTILSLTAIDYIGYRCQGAFWAVWFSHWIFLTISLLTCTFSIQKKLWAPHRLQVVTLMSLFYGSACFTVMFRFSRILKCQVSLHQNRLCRVFIS